MVLDRKTSFFLGKTWFWAEKPTFPGKKMVLGRKTNFSLGKTKKNKKNTSFETACGQTLKLCFFVFPRKKIVLGRKTNFFLGKKWFWAEKQTLIAHRVEWPVAQGSSTVRPCHAQHISRLGRKQPPSDACRISAYEEIDRA